MDIFKALKRTIFGDTVGMAVVKLRGDERRFALSAKAQRRHNLARSAARPTRKTQSFRKRQARLTPELMALALKTFNEALASARKRGRYGKR